MANSLEAAGDRPGIIWLEWKMRGELIVVNFDPLLHPEQMEHFISDLYPGLLRRSPEKMITAVIHEAGLFGEHREDQATNAGTHYELLGEPMGYALGRHRQARQKPQVSRAPTRAHIRQAAARLYNHDRYPKAPPTNAPKVDSFAVPDLVKKYEWHPSKPGGTPE